MLVVILAVVFSVKKSRDGTSECGQRFPCDTITTDSAVFREERGENIRKCFADDKADMNSKAFSRQSFQVMTAF